MYDRLYGRRQVDLRRKYFDAGLLYGRRDHARHGCEEAKGARRGLSARGCSGCRRKQEEEEQSDQEDQKVFGFDRIRLTLGSGLL